MNIALIHKNSGRIENVIVVDSIELAQTLFPDFSCVECGAMLFESGGTFLDGVVTRPLLSDTNDQTPKDELISSLMRRLGL